MKRFFNLIFYSNLMFSYCFLSVGNAQEAAAPTSTLPSVNAFVGQVNNGTATIQKSAVDITLLQSNGAITKLNASSKSYQAAAQACDAQVKQATFLCNEKTSPGAIAIQVGMSALPNLLAGKSASQTCSIMGDGSKLGNIATTAVKDKCIENKISCSSKCAESQTALGAVQKDISSLSTAIYNDANSARTKCASLLYGAVACETEVEIEEKALISIAQGLAAPATAQQASAVAPPIASCSALSLDIAKYTGQAADLALAMLGSNDCEKKLTTENPDDSAGGPEMDGGGGGEIGELANEMCKDPTIAETSVCKCKADPKGEGCPGIIAKNPGLFKTLGTGSQLAGLPGAFKQNGKISGLDGLKNSNGSSTDLTKKSEDTPSISSNALTSTDAGGGGNSTAGPSDVVKSNDSEKMKTGFGGFSSLGGGGGFFGLKKPTSGYFATDKQIADAKRKLASEKLQEGFTSASGKSNFDKVTTRYIENGSTFILGK